jgi:hypothetical protein
VLSRPDVQAVLAGSTPTSNDPVLAAAATARTRWLALHTFLARLWAERGVSLLALNALWAARDALEYPADSAGRPGSEALGPRALRIETAAIWLKIAGREMYASREIWGPRGNEDWPENAGKPGRGGELWDGVDGYDLGRWAVWKDSLEGIVKEQDLSENVRTVAKVRELWLFVIRALILPTFYRKRCKQCIELREAHELPDTR